MTWRWGEARAQCGRCGRWFDPSSPGEQRKAGGRDRYTRCSKCRTYAQTIWNQGPCCVYRLYGTDDALLYIGISIRPETRWEEHSKSVRWWPEVIRKEVSAWYPDRKEAVAAEVAAIKAERPRYNIRPAAANAATTHCVRGHEFTPENTGQQRNGRYCRTCKRDKALAYWARKRAEAAA